MTRSIEGPVATAQMMIRQPIERVFESLIEPSITSRFWFSKSSGPLSVGKRVRWDWEMYGLHTEVEVKALETNKRILLEWNQPEDPSVVEWTFEARGPDRTFVKVKNWGFAKGDLKRANHEAIASTGGFSFVLAAMKVFLEHGIEPNLIVDHDPDGLGITLGTVMYLASLNLKEHISKKNDEGKTALMLASEGGHDETVRVLTAAGANR